MIIIFFIHRYFEVYTTKEELFGWFELLNNGNYRLYNLKEEINKERIKNEYLKQ